MARDHIAERWHVPPWDLDDPDLQDELGRYIERINLQDEYAD